MISLNLINYQNDEYIDQFIEGYHNVFSDLNHEVILVDNYSDDGSYEKLSKIADHKVQAITTRGEARNIALMMSNNEVIVECLDTDQIPQESLKELVRWYLGTRPDFCLNTNGCMINTRDMVIDVGYGAEFQTGEDKYLWDWLIERGKLRHVKVNTAEHVDSPDDKEHPFYRPRYDYPQELFRNLLDTTAIEGGEA